MHLRLPSLLHILALVSLLQSSAPGDTSSSSNTLTLRPGAACPSSLVLGGHAFALNDDGGFHVYDATGKTDLALPEGTVTVEGKQTSFTTADASVRIHATFTSGPDTILVEGELENLKKDDRGFLVDYRLPVQFAKATFSSDLTQQLALESTVPASDESNLFPLAALSLPEGGVALAIPPTDPRVFGLIGDTRGLAIRFYLGITPKTKLFPNRASFRFIIYGVDPNWGFRSALSQYYGFYPDYYTPRLKKDGLYMFQMGGRTPPNTDQYGYDLCETQLPSLPDALARDQAHSITAFPYMIVGQREIKFLPSLPQTYEKAMSIFDRWTPADHASFALTKENACCLGDINLKDEVASSAVGTADGRYSMVLRKTLWGGNSISFKMNPNPYLFADEHRKTVGADALALTDKWLRDHPEYGGMFVDSLGANWPAVLNYRADHFPYARYPLTVDPDGRVALDNAISHYEYIEVLRTKMRETDRLLNGNGVYAYRTKKAEAKGVETQSLDAKKSEFIAQSAPPEIYRPGTKVSRFFLAALLDVASCEFGSKATVEQCEDDRVLLGCKQFSYLNYAWEDAAKVKEFVNKSLCFGIFASSTTNFFTGEPYESSLRGYLRDKELLDWYVPLVRKLSEAGWEPVRDANLEGPGLYGERFGHGDAIYFTIYNDSSAQLPAVLVLDLKALGLQDAHLAIEDIAHPTPLTMSNTGTVSLSIAPKTTEIIAVTRDNKTASN